MAAGGLTEAVSVQVRAEYEIVEKLGTGCFGSVYRVLRKADSAELALKVVRRSRLDSEAESLIRNEQEALQLISHHPGIVTLHDTLHTPTEVCFALDFVRGAPLFDKIASAGSFSENDASLALRAACKTLAYMSRVGVVHRDIKPENILCDSEDAAWPLKLTDFGLSAKLSRDALLQTSCGTPLFAAPEVLCVGRGYGCAADAWSLGVVLYVVLCGYAPFTQTEPAALVRAITRGEYTFPDPEWHQISEKAKDVVKKLMTVDPVRRLTPAQALQHPWFKTEQSTTALPNNALRDFCAHRKVRALSLTIKTACCLRRMVSAPTMSSPGALFEEVEHVRARVAEIENCTATVTATPATTIAPVKPSNTVDPQFVRTVTNDSALHILKPPSLPPLRLADEPKAWRMRSLVLPTWEESSPINAGDTSSPRSATDVDADDERRARAVVSQLRKSHMKITIPPAPPTLSTPLSASTPVSSASPQEQPPNLAPPQLAPLNFDAFG